MPETNYSKTTSVDTSMDSIVIVNLIEDIPGGRSLDVTGISEEVLKAGRVIIEETASGDLKPLGITGSSYDALPAGHTYKGILVASILKDKATASIMQRGTVNEQAAVSAAELPAYVAAMKTALPLIRFVKD